VKKSASNTTQRSSGWRIFWRLESIDFLVYSGGGAILLCYLIYKAGSAIWSTNSAALKLVYLLTLAGTVVSTIRDLLRRKFSLVSRLLVGAWIVCVAAIILIDTFLQ